MDEASLKEGALSTAETSPDPGPGAADKVVRDVIRGLYDGQYEPGQRLYEARLTKAYGISRGPVREALNKLAAIGIVELTLQRGARVKVLSLDEALDTLVVVQSLVALAARLASQSIDGPGARAKVESAMHNLARFAPSSSGAEFAIARDRFYATLTDIADNSQLKLILPAVRIHLIRVQFRSFLHLTDSQRHSDYARIARAVVDGRAAEAEAATRTHFGRAIEALQTFRDKS